MLRRLGTGVALTSMAALVLVGCAAPAPAPAPTASPASPAPPPSASAEELEDQLATVYAGFLNARTAVSAMDEATPTPMLRFATQAMADLAAQEMAVVIAQGYRYEGEFTVTSVALEEEGESALEAIVCIDNHAVRRIDRASGESSSPTSAADPAHVTFTREGSVLVDAVQPVPDGAEASCQP